jgi:isopenicillin-N N-acyltransferase-like protein
MASSRIPLHRVTGTHYECAHEIGSLTRDAIRRRIADDFAYLSKLFSFVQTDYGQKLHRDFIEIIRSLYPWYWDELRGLADGAEIPLEQVLVLNFLNETRTAYRLNEEKKKVAENETGEKGCTTVLINRKDTNILSLLHNEDHSTALFMTGYLVEADIKSSKYDEQQRESPDEKFVAYCYAGAIPGK